MDRERGELTLRGRGWEGLNAKRKREKKIKKILLLGVDYR